MSARVSNLVFYAQSTSTVVSGRVSERCIYIYTRKKKEEEKTHNKNKTTANQLHLNCTEYLINSFFACIAFPASSERRWGGGGGGGGGIASV